MTEKCYNIHVRKNMKPQPLSTYDEVMLKKRMLIETVIGQLKSQTQLQHTRHRSFLNFQVNILSALIAYTYLEKKPTLKLRVIDESRIDCRRPKTHKNFYGTHVIISMGELLIGMGLVTSLYHRGSLYNALLFFMGWNSYPQYGFQPRYLSEFPLPMLKHAQREQN